MTTNPAAYEIRISRVLADGQPGQPVLTAILSDEEHQPIRALILETVLRSTTAHALVDRRVSVHGPEVV